jgi:imidazolonepropionase-like amidohydrolase
LTPNIARFLRKEDEFGTVAVGKRADLLLLEQNPLENLHTFKQPLGVMVRGTWLPREELQRLLSRLQ